MRLYRTADEAMIDYLLGLEAASAPRGIDPEAIRGRVYVDACLACGGTTWRRKGHVELCAGVKRNGRRCDRPRDWEPASVPKGFFDTNPRPGAASAALDRLVTLGVIVHRAGMWPRRQLALYVMLGSYDRVRDAGRERWPRREHGWSEYGVKRDVRIARQRIEEGLLRSRMLRGDDLAA